MATFTVTTGSDVAVTSAHVNALRLLLAFVHTAKDLGDTHVKAIATQLTALEAVLLVKEDKEAATKAAADKEHGDYLDYLTEAAKNDPRY